MHRDPETGIQNASIHRMLVLDDKKRLAIRIVPRNLYTYFQKAQKLGKDLEIAIAIEWILQFYLQVQLQSQLITMKMDVANAFKNGELTLIKWET